MSPPLSPNQINNKYNNLDNKQEQQQQTVNNQNEEDQLSDLTTTTTASNDYMEISTTNLTNLNNNQIISSNESLIHADSNKSFKSISNEANDLETTYQTSVSKNLITLRKTESLKLDSVPTIR